MTFNSSFLLIHFFGTDNLIIINLLQIEIFCIMFLFLLSLDTFAYLIGVKFGKHKIMPSISPKKSWEGGFGGYIYSNNSPNNCKII